MTFFSSLLTLTPGGSKQKFRDEFISPGHDEFQYFAHIDIHVVVNNSVAQANHRIPFRKGRYIDFATSSQRGNCVVCRNRHRFIACLEHLFGFTYGVLDQHLQGMQYTALLQWAQSALFLPDTDQVA